MVYLKKNENRDMNAFRGGKQCSSAEAVLDFSLFSISFISQNGNFMDKND